MNTRLARYVGNGRVEIVTEALPPMPEGGLLVKSLACGLCSGELMSWYMDKKIPHVLGHEVCGVVEQSGDDRFPVGSIIFPHHHAPAVDSPWTKRGAAVHDPVWRSTKLSPGGMSERFIVPAANLTDTLRTDDMRPIDAALIEPLACVTKALSRLHLRGDEKIGVVGLGVMGLLFMLACPGAVGCDMNDQRVTWALGLGLDARKPEDIDDCEVWIVCPGTKPALDFALAKSLPDPRICLFAPMAPGEITPMDLHGLYFKDLTLTCSYSCGPQDTLEAARLIREGVVKAEQVVSDFVALDDLPPAYEKMKRGEILKAMVVF